MGRLIDLTGQRFGRLTVICRCDDNKSELKCHTTLWICKCDCGKTKIEKSSALREGRVVSCGCYIREITIDRNIRNSKHGQCDTRLYRVWNGMLRRCECKSAGSYKNYGAIGITVCKEWHDYTNFAEWARKSGYDESAPYGQCTIDRINVFGNYEPSNCRWADAKTQNRNKRKNSMEVKDV